MTDWKSKYPIGSQWKCRDGSKAVVVGHDVPDNYLIVANMQHLNNPDFYWMESDGFFYKNKSEYDKDLIEPWTEPRVFDVEVYIDQFGKARLNLDGNVTKTFKGGDIVDLKTIARKKITITEGEGLDD